MGSKVKYLNFAIIMSVVTIFYGNCACSQRNISNGILVRRPESYPLGGLRGWSGGQNSTEYGHVAYQIKENDACSNMVARQILDQRGRVKRSKHFFSASSIAAGNGAKSTMQEHILSLHTPSAPGVGSKDQNIFF